MAQRKILYSQLIGTKSFAGLSTKDAYMKAVKWYASNVISNNNMHEIQVEYVKGKEKDNYFVKIKMYAVLNSDELMSNFCDCCREMHKAFFINEATECSRCSAIAYKRRMEEKITIKSNYYREILKRNEKENV